MALEIQSVTGVTLNVRVVQDEKDAWYVCFYDTRHRALPRWAELGQPCGKYYLSTIVFREGPETRGLCINSGTPAWNINSHEMLKVLKYCREHASRVLDGKEG